MEVGGSHRHTLQPDVYLYSPCSWDGGADRTGLKNDSPFHFLRAAHYLLVMDGVTKSRNSWQRRREDCTL